MKQIGTLKRSVLALAALVSPRVMLAAPETQTVVVQQSLAIPDATLEPGEYQLSVEDQLADRAILRIERKPSGSHFLLLAVPNGHLKAAGPNGLVTFANGASGQVLRAFACSGCESAFEVAYPKPQAAQILARSGQAVVAFDPSYDKLPQNLSQDDMKVVTLWLASPKRITAEHTGEGVGLAKLADARPAVRASSDTDRKEPARIAGPQAAVRLPKTASNDPRLALAGLVLVCLSAFSLWLRRPTPYAA